MLGIFQTALREEGITDGYGISLYYPGVLGTGDLACAFGGGGPMIYKDKQNKVQFGSDGDDFRTYLQAMNTWYNNGWIDKAFPEHSADMFFRIDDVKVRQGKVGMWIGSQAQLKSRMAGDLDTNKDIVVFAARQPINDIYGTDAQKNKTPYTMYQLGLESGITIAVTDKAKDKDLEALFSFLDSLYSFDGGMVKSYGLTKEEEETVVSDLYERNGITNGSYFSVDTPDGKKYSLMPEILNMSGQFHNAVRASRLFGLQISSNQYVTESDSLVANLKEWIVYENTGGFDQSFRNQLSAADALEASKIETNLNEFMGKNIPNFIKGSKDPYNDDDWNAYVKAINKYKPQRYVEIYQSVLDTLN
jgi:hypothetical protein